MPATHRASLRRSGLAIVIDEAGRYLLTRRTPWIPHPLAWCFPGGRGRPGEPHREIVAREAREELGVAVVPQRELFRFVHGPWDESWWLASLGPGALRRSRFEVLRCGWFTRAEVLALPHFVQRPFLPACLARNLDLP